MPPKKLKESIIFLVNVGVVRHGTQSNLQLLENAKFILKHIIQKKIFLRPKDEVGVILMGSDCSGSDTVTGMDYVQELCSMQIGNWDLIENIEKLQTTDQSCSWMEGIFAAIEYIKHECVDQSERKLILLSDFNEEEDIVSQFQAKDIAKALSSEGIFLTAVGERTLDDTDKDSYTASEALLLHVLQEINGEYCTFEHVMSDVHIRFYKRPSTKPMPWYCNMELGDFHIPIAAISKMPSELTFPKTNKFDNQQVPIKNTVQWTDKNRTVQNKEDIIRGYVYGGKVIPVSEETEKAIKKLTENNQKCYKIHGFTARKNIPMEYWLSDGTYVIVPASESASRPFYSLIQAMIETNVVAIVEKIYRAKCEANMVALFPSVDVPNEPWTLIEIGLPFERDYGAIGQKPLNFVMKQLSEEQSNAMDDLLLSLELSDDIDDDKYLPGCMPDPSTQHMWDILSARALNPDKPLPPIADEVKNLLEQPEYVREKCKPIAEKMKDLFSLEKREPLRAKKRRNAEKENSKQSDNGNVVITQSAKIEEKDVSIDDQSKNSEPSHAYDFDFDDIID